MSCPICGRPKPINVHFTCTECWFEKVPSKDRMQLGAMLRKHQPTASKLQAVVAKIKANGLRG